MVKNRLNGELSPALPDRNRRRRRGYEKPRTPSRDSLRQLDSYLKRSDRDQFIDRRPPGARAGKIHKVQNEPPLLLVEVAIDQPGALHVKRNHLAGGPAYQIGEQVRVVREQLPQIPAIQVRRQ